MKKVYRIYFLKAGSTKWSVNDPFTFLLDRYGVTDYQEFDEAEEIVLENKLSGATILPVYLKS